MANITYNPTDVQYQTGQVLDAVTVDNVRGLNESLNLKNNILTGLFTALNTYYQKTNSSNVTISDSSSSSTVATVVGKALSGIIFDEVNNVGFKLNNNSLEIHLTSNASVVDRLCIYNLTYNSGSDGNSQVLVINTSDNRVGRTSLATSSPSTTNEYVSEFITDIAQKSYGKIYNLSKKKIDAIKNVQLTDNTLIVTDKTGTNITYRLFNPTQRYYHSIKLTVKLGRAYKQNESDPLSTQIVDAVILFNFISDCGEKISNDDPGDIIEKNGYLDCEIVAARKSDGAVLGGMMSFWGYLADDDTQYYRLEFDGISTCFYDRYTFDTRTDNPQNWSAEEYDPVPLIEEE